LRDHFLHLAEGSEVCPHCGQPLPKAVAPYGERRTSRVGLAATVGLHLLLLAIYLLRPENDEKRAKPSAPQSETVWVAPQPSKPQRREQAPKPVLKPSRTKPHPERVQIQRLPNTITVPNEKPVEVAKAEPKRAPPQEVDMQAYIEARRRQRGVPDASDQPAEESEQARGMRNALANIAAINGRGNDNRNDTGGVFSISNRTFHSMDLKFRGWNPSFKRRWLTQLTVEQGNERDVESAVVKKMIELIRREKTGDFEWESHRLGRVVTMSARLQDTEQLTAFLFKEMFPDYKPPVR